MREFLREFRDYLRKSHAKVTQGPQIAQLVGVREHPHSGAGTREKRNARN